MKLVYIVTRADAVGGASIHVRDMARAMMERGHEATVLIGGAGPVTEQLSAAGVPFRSLKYLARAVRPWRDLRAEWEIGAVLEKMRPDLVSTHTAKAGWVGRSAAHRLGIPAVYTPHGWAIGDRISQLSGRVFTIAERIAARWSRAIVCVSEYEKQLALESRVAPPGKLFVVHNGVRDVPDQLLAVPAKDPVRICSIARLERPKDHVTLLNALSRLAETPWTLDMVGDGPLLGPALELAESLGIASRVHFTGYLPDPAAALAEAQIFALSSRSEGFPRSVLEAMRAGLPVVASDVGGIREAVEHGAAGLLVPPGDPDKLAGALGALLRDSALRQRMGAFARRTYDEKFRLERMIESTVGIYATVQKKGTDLENRL